MVRFIVKCIKSNDQRFIVDSYYVVNQNGSIWDEEGNTYGSYPTTNYYIWFKEGNWYDYDFMLVQEFPLRVEMTIPEIEKALGLKSGTLMIKE